jgi:hypothetical protein
VVDDGLTDVYERMLCQTALERAYHDRMRALLDHALDRMDEQWLTFTYDWPERGAEPAAWLNGPAKGDQGIEPQRLRALLGDRLFACIAHPGVRIVLTNWLYTVQCLQHDGEARYEPPVIVPGNAALFAHDWIGTVESADEHMYVVHSYHLHVPHEERRMLGIPRAARFLHTVVPSREPNGILHFPFRFPPGEYVWQELRRRSGQDSCATPAELTDLLKRHFLNP